MDSRTKDKIYAFLSFLAIVLVVGSFVFVVEFLLDINKYIFSVNEAIVKEKTTVVDKAGFTSIIGKLKAKGVSGTEAFQIEKNPVIENNIPPETSPAADVPSPDLSPGPSFSPLPDISPNPSPEIIKDKVRVPAGVDVPVPGSVE